MRPRVQISDKEARAKMRAPTRSRIQVTATYQDSIWFANSPHINFVVLSTSDKDSGWLLSNFEAVDIGGVRNKLLCNLVVKDDILIHHNYNRLLDS